MSGVLLERVTGYISAERLARWGASHTEPMTLEDAYDVACMNIPGELCDEVEAVLDAALPNTT
jgi:hypothetical protein